MTKIVKVESELLPASEGALERVLGESELSPASSATQWLCPNCPYMNVGPICTKCGTVPDSALVPRAAPGAGVLGNGITWGTVEPALKISFAVSFISSVTIDMSVFGKAVR